jgi:hypothetical protein
MARRRKQSSFPITDFQYDSHAVIYALLMVRYHRKSIARLTIEQAPQLGLKNITEPELKELAALHSDELRKLEAMAEWDAEQVCGLTLEEIERASGPELDALEEHFERVCIKFNEAMFRRAEADGLNAYHTVWRMIRGKFGWR